MGSRRSDLLASLAEAGDIGQYLVREVDETIEEADRAVLGALAALLGYGAGKTRWSISSVYAMCGYHSSASSSASWSR